MENATHFEEEVSRRLECLICMDRLRNPKDLHCHHTFCKECIEGVLKFRKDGSAVIKCPLRCDGQTFIPKDKTTKDLAPPFKLKAILEVFEEGVGKSQATKDMPLCKNAHNCRNEITAYCSTCHTMMCHVCRQKHEGDNKTAERGQETHQFIPIEYNEKEQELKIICSEHSAVANYVCCEGKYICIFCRNRSHHGHTQHCMELQAKHTKGLLTHHVKNVERAAKAMQRSLIAAERSIAHCRATLSKSLKSRKILCLSNYVKFLNKKEEQIKKEFEAKTLNHIRRYKETDPIKYFSKALRFDNTSLILEREAILVNISQWKSGNVGVPLLSIGLSDANYYDKNSLGVLKDSLQEDVMLVQPATKLTFHYDIPQPDASSVDFSVIDGLKELLNEAYTILKRGGSNEEETTAERNDYIVDRPRTPCAIGKPLNDATKWDLTNSGAVTEYIQSPSVTIGKEEKKIQKKALKEVAKNLKKQGVNYVYDIIKENDLESFDFLVSAKPDIGKLRGSFGSTPLLTAGRFNRVAILKRLLQHGSTLDDKGSSGSNVLHISAFHDSYEALAWLSPQCQHLINETNIGDKRTALHYAACNGYLRCMKLLLKHGANLHIKDKDECTALDKAKELGKEACVEGLQKTLMERGEEDSGKYADCRSAEEFRTKYNLE